jgi:hypothetical protein
MARPRAASPFNAVNTGKPINLNVLNGKLMRAVLLAGVWELGLPRKPMSAKRRLRAAAARIVAAGIRLANHELLDLVTCL